MPICKDRLEVVWMNWALDSWFFDYETCHWEAASCGLSKLSNVGIPRSAAQSTRTHVLEEFSPS